MVRHRRRGVVAAIAASAVLSGCSAGSADEVGEACRLITRAQDSVSSATQQPEESRNLATLARQLDAAHQAVEGLSSRRRERLVSQCSAVVTLTRGTNRASAFSAIAGDLLQYEEQLAVMMTERREAQQQANEQALIAAEIASACEAIINSRSPDGNSVTLLLDSLGDAKRWIESDWSDDTRSAFFHECEDVDRSEVVAEIETLTGLLTEIAEEQQAERERRVQERVEQQLRRGLDAMQRWWDETHWAAQSVMCQSFDKRPVREAEGWSSVVNGGTTLSGTTGDVRPEHAFVFFTEACNDQMRRYCNHSRACSGLIDWNARP